MLHACTKHINMHHHAVRERIARQEVVFDYCPTADMVADALTQGLPRPAFEKCRDGMGLVFAVWPSASGECCMHFSRGALQTSVCLGAVMHAVTSVSRSSCGVLGS